MSTVFSWQVSGVKKDDSGGVYSVRWKVVATSTEFSLPKEIKKEGELSFDPDPSDPDFTPFENLTQAEVMLWIFTRLDRDFIETDLDEVVQSFGRADAWEDVPP